MLSMINPKMPEIILIPSCRGDTINKLLKNSLFLIRFGLIIVENKVINELVITTYTINAGRNAP